MKKKMKIEHIKITPTMAEKWLETRPIYQRKIDIRQVNKLRIAINNNEWRENGATIVFNQAGELLDGQHRLQAILESGKSIYSLVVNQVSNGEATFQTIGDEKPRKLGDFLKCGNTNVVGAVIRFNWFIQNKIWPPSNEVIPYTDLLKVSKEYIEYISTLVQPLSSAGRLTKQTSFIVFLVLYYTKIYPVNEKQLSNFFARLGDGLELKANDPVFQLRRRFLSQPNTQKIPRIVAQALILKAFNLEAQNKPCNGPLRWEPNREEFPSLLGLNIKPTINKSIKSEKVIEAKV